MRGYFSLALVLTFSLNKLGLIVLLFSNISLVLAVIGISLVASTKGETLLNIYANEQDIFLGLVPDDWIFRRQAVLLVDKGILSGSALLSRFSQN